MYLNRESGAGDRRCLGCRMAAETTGPTGGLGIRNWGGWGSEGVTTSFRLSSPGERVSLISWHFWAELLQTLEFLDRAPVLSSAWAW